MMNPEVNVHREPDENFNGTDDQHEGVSADGEEPLCRGAQIHVPFGGQIEEVIQSSGNRGETWPILSAHQEESSFLIGIFPAFLFIKVQNSVRHDRGREKWNHLDNADPLEYSRVNVPVPWARVTSEKNRPPVFHAPTEVSTQHIHLHSPR
jgi:hypothetical protein